MRGLTGATRAAYYGRLPTRARKPPLWRCFCVGARGASGREGHKVHTPFELGVIRPESFGAATLPPLPPTPTPTPPTMRGVRALLPAGAVAARADDGGCAAPSPARVAALVDGSASFPVAEDGRFGTAALPVAVVAAASRLRAAADLAIDMVITSGTSRSASYAAPCAPLGPRGEASARACSDATVLGLRVAAPTPRDWAHPCPHLHWDWARPSPRCHEHWARRCHICTGARRACAADSEGCSKAPRGGSLMFAEPARIAIDATDAAK
jgi:hypothetical protein